LALSTPPVTDSFRNYPAHRPLRLPILPELISQQIRLLGLFADAAVALIIYLSLRSRTSDALQALIPASLFLALPAISTSPLYFFHSDTFAYPILALATLTLIQQRYFIGTTLLATATIL